MSRRLAPRSFEKERGGRMPQGMSGHDLSDAKLFANRSALFANDAESAMIACSLL